MLFLLPCQPLSGIVSYARFRKELRSLSSACHVHFSLRLFPALISFSFRRFLSFPAHPPANLHQRLAVFFDRILDQILVHDRLAFRQDDNDCGSTVAKPTCEVYVSGILVRSVEWDSYQDIGLFGPGRLLPRRLACRTRWELLACSHQRYLGKRVSAIDRLFVLLLETDS